MYYHGNNDIIYLRVAEACLKVTIAMVYFGHSKNSSNIMNFFLIPSLYTLEKKLYLSTKIRNKCATRKINLDFFDIMKDG